jgi:hypothetical protein
MAGGRRIGEPNFTISGMLNFWDGRTCAVSTLSKMVCLMFSPAAYLASVMEKNDVFIVSPISSLHSRINLRICTLSVKLSVARTE